MVHLVPLVQVLDRSLVANLLHLGQSLQHLLTVLHLPQAHLPHLVPLLALHKALDQLQLQVPDLHSVKKAVGNPAVAPVVWQ
jgi:hypothetical protein